MSIPGLTREEVLTIRALYAEGITQWTLARQFRTPQGTVSKIINGTTYRDISMGPIRRVCRDCNALVEGRCRYCPPCRGIRQAYAQQKWYACQKAKMDA